MNAQWRTRTLGNVRTILYGTPLRARFTHGASWNVIGTALAQVLTLAQSILLAHFLGRMAYGQFGLLASTVQTFVVMGTLGAGIGATKFVAEFRDRAPETAGAMIGNSLALGLVAGTVVALAIVPSAGYLSRVLLHTASLRLPLILAAGLIPLYAVAWAQGGALQVLENFGAVAVLHTIRVTVALIATVLLTPVFGISGAIGALIIG